MQQQRENGSACVIGMSDQDVGPPRPPPEEEEEDVGPPRPPAGADGDDEDVGPPRPPVDAEDEEGAPSVMLPPKPKKTKVPSHEPLRQRVQITRFRHLSRAAIVESVAKSSTL